MQVSQWGICRSQTHYLPTPLLQTQPSAHWKSGLERRGTKHLQWTQVAVCIRLDRIGIAHGLFREILGLSFLQ